MSVIFTRAPLRLSLGGGGTDLPSYYTRRGGFLIAGSIDKYVYMLTHTVFQRRYRLKYSSFEEVDDRREIKHPIFREVLSRHWDGDPLEVATIADVPAGTGLGSSGSFTVCLLKGLALASRRPTTPAALAEAACTIEIDVLAEPVGKQDQYAAAHGGLSTYEFNPDGSVEVVPLHVSSTTLDRLGDNLLLFWTGETHSASDILRDQDTRTHRDEQGMLDGLDRIKEIGRESVALLESGDLEAFAAGMHEHWEAKRVRSPNMTTPHIDELYSAARNGGAIGGKLVGAGGGGFLLVYAEDPKAVRQAMTDRGVMELRFGFDFEGCTGAVYA